MSMLEADEVSGVWRVSLVSASTSLTGSMMISSTIWTLSSDMLELLEVSLVTCSSFLRLASGTLAASSAALCERRLFLLRGRGVRDLIGDVGDGARKFLIEGCQVLSLVAFLEVGRPFFVGEADCGL